MHFFLHIVLQYIYVVSFTLVSFYGIRYQARVYLWCIQNRLPINLTMTKESMVWFVSLIVAGVCATALFSWFDWSVFSQLLAVSMPLLIISLTLMHLNESHFRAYDCSDVHENHVTRHSS